MRNPAEQRPDDVDTARETETEYVEPHFDRAGAEAVLRAWGAINAAMVAERVPESGATPDNSAACEDAGAEHTGGEGRIPDLGS